MPFAPLRFVHASGLYLDRAPDPLSRLTDAVSGIVERATHCAFERIVSLAVDEDVDFVLLSDFNLDCAQPTVPSRVLLRRGFERLNEREIRVFISPRCGEDGHALREIEDLSDNVTVFAGGDEEPIAVFRDGHVIASVVGDACRSLSIENKVQSQAESSADFTRGPFTVGLLAVAGNNRQSKEESEEQIAATLANVDKGAFDYLALPRGRARDTKSTESGLAHDPGDAQGMHRDATGPRGCSLVTVAAEGAIDCRFHPTASVRWESKPLVVDSGTDRDALIEMLAEAVEQCSPEAGEKVWLMDWNVRGSGRLFGQLSEEKLQAELFEAVTDLASPPGGLLFSHSMQLCLDVEAIVCEHSSDSLIAQYFELLDSGASYSPQLLNEFLDEASLANNEVSDKLRPLVEELDGDAVAAHVRRMGAEWFSNQPKGGGWA